MKKRNFAGWQLISTSTSILDAKKTVFKFIHSGKTIINLNFKYLIFFAIRLKGSNTPHTLISESETSLYLSKGVF